ncbi:MAG TPA: hypothetical protein VFU71_08235 [Burkholderiaceae bacterium]|nr:hypothetical protein [Burkholderiaceae bacterium]
MNAPRHSRRPPTNGVGGGRAWRPSIGYLAVALGIVAGGFAVLLMVSPAPTVVVAEADSLATEPVNSTQPLGATPVLPVQAATHPTPSVPVHAVAATSTPAPATPRVPPRLPRQADEDQTPDLSDYVNPGETPTMAEVIDRLHAAGIHSGLGAFSPPGTRPPLVGLAVPQDFAVPEGYVRHHQATDDGQRIEAVLMFSPDYQFVDAAGTPIAIPKDRVVPPELAPLGLPLRRIVVPAPIESGRPGR